MLDYLHVRGLALLDDVALDFEPGMNVLTGETGAGKSIIVDALTLLRGGRGRSELIREGDDLARVEAQFAAQGLGSGVVDQLGELGSNLDEGALVLERRLRRSGRGRVAIQSSLATLAALAKIGGELIEICSQHEHHSLTNVAHHLDLLDAYAELDGPEGPLVDYATHYRSWRELSEQIDDIREREAERLQRADYLRFQIEELERVAPEHGEYDELRGRLALLRRAHDLGSFAVAARAELYDNDNALVSRLAFLSDRAGRLPEGIPALAEIIEQLQQAQIACEEAAAATTRLADAIELGPGELEHAQERLHELERLRRKHGCEVDELIERIEAMRAELDSLDGAEEALAELEQQASVEHRACVSRAKALHRARADAAKGLARAIEAELDALHIPGARLEVELRPLEGAKGELGPRGSDRAELRFCANPGEPLAPLNRVASGGELSRVLLAIKSVLSTQTRVATYVFDEVDAGVGGAVAEAIGMRLRKAATHHQVLCITHLPQIAACADAHFRVRKQVVGGRTVTRVERLSEEQRVEELARMLGGKRVTASAREHARALMDQARKVGAKGKKKKVGGKKKAAGKVKARRKSARAG